jgi:hypothetical protein
MDETYREAAAACFEGPTLGSAALLVGVRTAIARACEKYDVDDLKDESVPADLREFVTTAMDVSVQYIQDICGAFEID